MAKKVQKRSIDDEIAEMIEEAIVPSDDVVQFVRDYTYALSQMGNSADAERVMDMILSQRVHLRQPLALQFVDETDAQDGI